MIICHSRKFIFIHIHKTGGTSVERALDPHLAWNDLILGGSAFGERIQAAYMKKFGLNKHSTVAEIEKVCGSGILDEYFVFSVVRNPLSRLCSMYNFVGSSLKKWADEQGIDLREIPEHTTREALQQKPALKWVSSKVFLRSKDFSEFIRHKRLSEAPGFRTQLSSLTGLDTETLKSRFFRLEDYPAWVEELSERLGLQLELPKANESGVKFQQDSVVSAEDADYIKSLFRADYEAFGYPV
ncbi:MAG TPA: sulfotransferase family 2 domain-containing protein [Rhizomicrobium sp.]|jgi:hypothetical protein